MSPKTALAIRHVLFEDLGCLADVLVDAGYAIRYIEATASNLAAIDPIGPDLVIVLGGPIGVYQEQEYPFLTAELQFMQQRLTRNRPTLGICLGAQLIARALGAQVYAGSDKEIGWAPVALTDAGRASALAPLEKIPLPVLHWHGDTFTLPPGAVNLASTPAYQHQAFSVGANILGLQFHLEVQPEMVEAWLVGHAAELVQARIAPAALRADTSKQNQRMLQEIAGAVLSEWISELQIDGEK
jgi:GMP synthase (glutamine-hydrolysing)